MTESDVSIIDATLREGMQTAAGPFTTDQSVDVARALVACDVDMIECGHPAIGPGEQERVNAVVKAARDVPVLAHARADRGDIDAVGRTNATWVGIFLGINDISLRTRLTGRSRAELFRMIERSVRYARTRGLRVRFTVEDASRTDVELLAEAYALAVGSGAERICVADTVGVLEPAATAGLITALREYGLGVDIEAHLHDDRDLALANALAAIDAGARWISTSVNGLGERAGIVDLGALLANLAFRGGRALPEGRLLRDTSRLVGAYSRSAPDHRRPVVGRNAFHHVARLHRQAVERDTAAYEWIAAELVAADRGTDSRELSPRPRDWIVTPQVISAEELRHHRRGPGERYVLVDDRFVPGAGQYCIARRIPELADYGPGHVDGHVHDCDSLFVFLGAGDGYRGLSVEVNLGNEYFTLHSPASTFIPAGVRHSYRVLGGAGTYLNHVLAGDYNSSLLETSPDRGSV